VLALQVATNNRSYSDAEVWKIGRTKKVIKEGEDPCYGKTTETLSGYENEYKRLHGEDSRPLEEPIDEMALMISGTGRQHGRLKMLNSVVESTITLSQI
jgi:hypothetical protein